MANVDALSEIIRQIALAKGGGIKKPVTEKINEVFDSLKEIGIDRQKMRQIQEQSIQRALDRKKSELDINKSKLDIESTTRDLSPATDVATPSVRSRLLSSENSDIPIEDLVSGNLDTRGKGIEEARNIALEAQNKFGGLNMGEAMKAKLFDKDKPSLPEGDVRSAISSGYASADFLKEIFPTLNENDLNKISIGQLKQQVQLNRQSDLKSEREDRRDERISQKQAGIIDKFNADPAVRKSQQSIDSANLIRTLASSGNPIAAGSIPTFSARMSGEVGNLSEADKRPFGGSRAILTRMDAALEEMGSGRLTEENMKFISELTDLIENRARGNMQNLARTRSKQFSKVGLFGNEEEIFGLLSPDPVQNVQTQSPTGLTPEKRQRLEELRRKKAEGTLQ